MFLIINFRSVSVDKAVAFHVFMDWEGARSAGGEQPISVGGENAEETTPNKDGDIDAATAEKVTNNSSEFVQSVTSEEESTFCKICDIKSFSAKGWWKYAKGL